MQDCCQYAASLDAGMIILAGILGFGLTDSHALYKTLQILLVLSCRLTLSDLLHKIDVKMAIIG